MTWSVCIVLVVLVYCVAQLWWTRRHGQNLERHTERMRRLYDEDRRR